MTLKIEIEENKKRKKRETPPQNTVLVLNLLLSSESLPRLKYKLQRQWDMFLNKMGHSLSHQSFFEIFRCLTFFMNAYSKIRIFIYSKIREFVVTEILYFLLKIEFYPLIFWQHISKIGYDLVTLLGWLPKVSLIVNENNKSVP